MPNEIILSRTSDAYMKIKYCIDNKSTILDLSNLHLKKIPNNLNLLFTNLLILDCSNNKLQGFYNDLLHNNKTIEYILCLPPTLQKLNCSHNKIKNVPNTLSMLSELDCSHNKITELNLKMFPNLLILNCSDNDIEQLTDLPTNLVLLNCWGNKQYMTITPTMAIKFNLEVTPNDFKFIQKI